MVFVKTCSRQKNKCTGTVFCFLSAVQTDLNKVAEKRKEVAGTLADVQAQTASLQTRLAEVRESTGSSTDKAHSEAAGKKIAELKAQLRQQGKALKASELREAKLAKQLAKNVADAEKVAAEMAELRQKEAEQTAADRGAEFTVQTKCRDIRYRYQ